MSWWDGSTAFPGKILAYQATQPRSTQRWHFGLASKLGMGMDPPLSLSRFQPGKICCSLLADVTYESINTSTSQYESISNVVI